MDLLLQEAGRLLGCAVSVCSSDLFSDLPRLYQRWFFLANCNFSRKQKCSLLAAWVSVIPCLFMLLSVFEARARASGVRVRPSPNSFVAFASSSVAPALDPFDSQCMSCGRVPWVSYGPYFEVLFCGPFFPAAWDLYFRAQVKKGPVSHNNLGENLDQSILPN